MPKVNLKGRKRPQKRTLALEDNTYTLRTYCEKLMMHPRTIVRRLTGPSNPSVSYIDNTIVHIEDMARAFNCELPGLRRVMTGKAKLWTQQQAAASFGVTVDTIRKAKYPKFIDAHKCVRYIDKDIVARHMKRIEI